MVNSGSREKLKMPVFALSSMVRGYHVYKVIWDADEGEILDCVRETTNHHDPYAVAVSKNGIAVGHVPRKISPLCSLFIRRGRGGTISCRVDGSRRRSWDLPQGGMEIPCTLTFTAEEQFLIDKIRNLIKDVSEVEVVANPKMKQEDSRDSSPRPKMRKLDPDEQVLSNTLDNDWVRLDAHRVLKTSEREVIFQNKKLDDLVINFAQILLKRQFPSLNGLFILHATAYNLVTFWWLAREFSSNMSLPSLRSLDYCFNERL